MNFFQASTITFLGLFVIFFSPDLFAKDVKAENSSVVAIVTREAKQFDDFLKEKETAALETNQGTPADQADASDAVAKVKALYEQVTMNGRMLELLTAETEWEFPVGISKTISNRDYTIIIEGISITATGAKLTASMYFVNPEDGTEMAFRATDLEYSKWGGFSGQLELLGEVPIKLGAETSVTLKGIGNYVNVDCEGFQGFGLAGEIAFSRSLFVPEDAEGKRLPSGQVSAAFALELADWNDFMVQGISLPPFQFAGLADVGFVVTDANLDLSDLANPSSLPSAVIQNAGTAAVPELWRGFYLGEIAVRLPKGFNRENGEELTILGNQLSVDFTGFSGIISAQNVLPDGSLAKWPVSITDLAIEFKNSEVEGAGFGGSLKLPAITEPVPYSAHWNSEAIAFTISPPEQVNMNMFVAQLQLDKNSTVSITKDRDGFHPEANLYGMLSLSPSLGGNDVAVQGLRFEGLKLQAKPPILQIEHLALGNAKIGFTVGGIGASIDSISIESTTASNEVKLNFDLNLQLSKDFSGKGGFSVVGKMDGDLASSRFIPSFEFDRLKLRKLQVDYSNGGNEFTGQVEWFEESPIYGNGLSGDIYLKVGAVGIEANASAMFGRFNDYRYWYVDTEVNGLGKGPAPIFLTSFYGGIYSNIKMNKGKSSASGIGSSARGLKFLPMNSKKLVIQAEAEFQTAKRSILSGEGVFQMIMNKGGGINRIGLFGRAEMLSYSINLDLRNELAAAGQRFTDALCEEVTILNPERLGNKVKDVVDRKVPKLMIKGGMQGYLNLVYDGPAKSFTGDLKLHVKYPGILKGIGSNNLAGDVRVHADPRKWYLHLGNSSLKQRVGLEFLGLAEAQTYLMIGHDVPSKPQLPDAVTSFFKKKPTSILTEDFAKGTGFAHGAYFNIDTGEKSFLMFYAQFAAHIGYDLSLVQLGSEVQCNSSGSIGLNGWYGNGQAYAGLQGKIGIQAKILGKKRKFDIIDLQTGALIEAGLPNPTWMQANLGLEYSVMGGLVKGKGNFKLQIGEECDPNSGETFLDGIDVIADMLPADGAQEVDVFSNPQVSFNLPVNQTINISDDLGENNKIKVVLESLKLSYEGNEIPFARKWNNSHDAIILTPEEILPENAEILVQATVKFQEQSGGSYVDVKDAGLQSLTHTFVSGPRPNYVPLQNVSYTYPAKDQHNYYQAESQNHFIQLSKDQGYLFEDPAYETKGFLSSTGSTSEFDLTYNASNKQIRFSMPENLKNEEIFDLKLVKQPIATNQEATTKESYKKTSSGADVRNNKLAASSSSAKEAFELFAYKFRSSKYNSFAEKVEAIDLTQVEISPYGFEPSDKSKARKWTVAWRIDEAFDRNETNGFMQSDPLVQITASVDGSDWFGEEIAPIYKGFPLIPGMERNGDFYGIATPPVDATRFVQSSTLSTSLSKPSTAGSGTIDYNIAVAGEMDHDGFVSAINHYVSSGKMLTPAMRNLKAFKSKGITAGDYEINFTYVLPGSSSPQSSVSRIVSIGQDMIDKVTVKKTSRINTNTTINKTNSSNSNINNQTTIDGGPGSMNQNR